MSRVSFVNPSYILRAFFLYPSCIPSYTLVSLVDLSCSFSSTRSSTLRVCLVHPSRILRASLVHEDTSVCMDETSFHHPSFNALPIYPPLMSNNTIANAEPTDCHIFEMSATETRCGKDWPLSFADFYYLKASPERHHQPLDFDNEELRAERHKDVRRLPVHDVRLLSTQDGVELPNLSQSGFQYIRHRSTFVDNAKKLGKDVACPDAIQESEWKRGYGNELKDILCGLL